MSRRFTLPGATVAGPSYVVITHGVGDVRGRLVPGELRELFNGWSRLPRCVRRAVADDGTVIAT